LGTLARHHRAESDNASGTHLLMSRSGTTMRAVAAPLTAKQMAKALGVAERTIWRWLEKGKITCTRLPNGAVRFRESDVQFMGGPTR